jgi:hypothetical protein
MLTGIAGTELVEGNNCGADDQDCAVATVGELQALLVGAPILTGPLFEVKLELE